MALTKKKTTKRRLSQSKPKRSKWGLGKKLENRTNKGMRGY